MAAILKIISFVVVLSNNCKTAEATAVTTAALEPSPYFFPEASSS